MATEETVQVKKGVNPAQVAMLVGGLVLVFALVWFFFLRGGDASVEPQTSPTPATTEDAAGVAREGDDERTATKDDKKKEPVETFELFASKDPFEPLIDSTPAATGATAPATTAPPATITPGTTDPGTTDPGTTDPGTTDPGAGGQAVGGHTVRLVDVFSQNGSPRAQVSVDGSVYTVAEGETFADSFQLTSVSGTCATMLFGDDQFTLCEGEEILK
jgi:cytoskeletal protein RodZ